MKLQLDTSIPYALALEGGGARGAYQIGAWRALREAGVTIGAVAGTSVGAINGAMIAMGDWEKARDIWENIRYSKVMDVDDEAMARILHRERRPGELRQTAGELMDTLRKGGLDVTPLRRWMSQVVDEEAIHRSHTELYIVTYSLTDQKVLELRAREMSREELCDMLLASAYLPVFRNEPLGGKRYVDGGVRDVLPLHVLLDNGWKNILAVRLYGFGVQRPVRIPQGVKIRTIEPTSELGGTLEFEPEKSRANMTAGYYDAMRLLYGLRGRRWYIDSQWSEQEAHAFLLNHVHPPRTRDGRELTLREIHERHLPALARRLEVPNGDYRDIALAWLESAAETAGLDRWRIYTESELAARTDGAAALPPQAEEIHRRKIGIPRRRGAKKEE